MTPHRHYFTGKNCSIHTKFCYTKEANGNETQTWLEEVPDAIGGGGPDAEGGGPVLWGPPLVEVPPPPPLPVLPS